jgi:hypothetical protein
MMSRVAWRIGAASGTVAAVDAVAVRVRALGTPAAVALLAVALLAGVEIAHAQCDPTTMTEGQKERLALRTRDEIVDLEEVKRKIEVEHHGSPGSPGWRDPCNAGAGRRALRCRRL